MTEDGAIDIVARLAVLEFFVETLFAQNLHSLNQEDFDKWRNNALRLVRQKTALEGDTLLVAAFGERVHHRMVELVEVFCGRVDAKRKSIPAQAVLETQKTPTEYEF